MDIKSQNLRDWAGKGGIPLNRNESYFLLSASKGLNALDKNGKYPTGAGQPSKDPCAVRNTGNSELNIARPPGRRSKCGPGGSPSDSEAPVDKFPAVDRMQKTRSNKQMRAASYICGIP